MIPNLGIGVGLAANEHPCHHILRHIRFHLARVEGLHQHQHHQGHVQGHIPRQARAAIGVFASALPMTPHDLEEGVPRQSALELEQRMVAMDIERDGDAVCACPWADPRRTMALFFHEVLLRGIHVHTPRHIRKNSGFSTQDEHMVLLGLEALTEALYLRYATCSTYVKVHRGHLGHLGHHKMWYHSRLYTKGSLCSPPSASCLSPQPARCSPVVGV